MVGKYCRSTFDVHLGNVGVIELAMGGPGFASFGTDTVLHESEVLGRDVIPMEWEASHVAGLHPLLGLVCCNARVKDKSTTPSNIVMYSAAFRQRQFAGQLDSERPFGEKLDEFSKSKSLDNSTASTSSTSPVSPDAMMKRLFPATMMNRLHFEIELPGIRKRIFNKDPMILVGQVQNLDEAVTDQDPRVVRYPNGRSPHLGYGGLNPVGIHELQSPVPFLDAEKPDVVVATLLSARIAVVPHYGLDVQLVSQSVDGAIVTTVWEIKNLLPQKQTILWFADDSYKLHIVSSARGEPIVIDKDPVTVRVQAVNAEPNKSLDRRSCIFFQCSSLADSFAGFSSAFGYTDGDLLQGKSPDEKWK